MRTTRRALGWTAAALTLVPLGACYYDLPGAVAYESAAPAAASEGGYAEARAPQAEVPRSYAINQNYERELFGQCVYRSSVRGTLLEVPAQDPAIAGSDRLVEPQLAVDARVDCPNIESSHASRGTLSGLRLTPPELARALEARATVVTLHEGRVCTARPIFAVTGDGAIAQQAVNASCAAPNATGGGPTDETQGPSPQPQPYDEQSIQSPGWGGMNRGVH